MLTETDFLVLNAVYLKKVVAAPQIVEMTGVAVDDVARCLEAATEQGWLMEMDMGGADGVMLLEDGITQVMSYYQEVYADLRSNTVQSDWYQSFESLNKRFVAAVTEWQETDGSDRSEQRVLQAAERLVKDIGRLVPIIPRYSGYVDRMERSMDRVDAGERDYVCNPTIDSIHNIWFEFHEDILTVLGRQRDTT
ncbi:hypothetical protein [uncultured Marinobacter sp.]|uniref:hypothetical protein n=1 Tax=uncultured Marinobacter sp. TaxID=187379 RepID=UPI0030DB0670|tara:strand:+ start:25283 stop:25864 length:582 start_codon:yes stop_codon:yes gene_type:complete